MTLKEVLEVVRDSTRVQLRDEHGNPLTAPLHKRDLTDTYDNFEVVNICTRYTGNGHTIRFYLQIEIKKDTN